MYIFLHISMQGHKISPYGPARKLLSNLMLNRGHSELVYSLCSQPLLLQSEAEPSTDIYKWFSIFKALNYSLNHTDHNYLGLH